jgi:nitrilase
LGELLLKGVVAETTRNEQGILYVEIDRQRTGIAKRALGITGHYARPDIFQLHVNTQPQSPVRFD